MEVNEKDIPTSVAITSSPEGVPAQGAKFAGSFDVNQRDRADESALPIPRAIINTKTILRPLTQDWTNRTIWGSAASQPNSVIEGVGTMSLCYTSALIDVTFGNFDTKFAPNWVGITNIILLSLFIYATAPSSGGHLNPLITFTTMLTGLAGFSRAILYMIGQTTGAAVAGGLVRASFGHDATTKYNGGGCFFDEGAFPPGRAFVIEMMSSFILVFLAFGVALDPRQARLSGPMLGPFLVGCSLGLLSFASAGIAPGYAGASMNPARCFAFAIGRGNFTYQWIWWFGPLAGSVLGAIIYRTIPPYHAERRSKT